MSSGRGRFIVIEGIDGSGSTSQARRLVERLQNAGVPALFTCQPSDGNVGRLIRGALEGRLDTSGQPVRFDWVTMALLFAADRADHVHRVIEPALAQGISVVSDRYDLSSLAYQSVTSGAAAEAVPWIRALNSRVLRPDLTLVVDVSADTAARRRAERGGATELYEVEAIQRRLADVYQSAEQLVVGDRVTHIDGELALDEVADRVWAAVAE